MNEKRVLQRMPAGMGCIRTGPYTQIWLCVSVLPEPDKRRPKRITETWKAEQKRARRREITRHILQTVFVIGTGTTWAAAAAILIQMAR